MAQSVLIIIATVIRSLFFCCRQANRSGIHLSIFFSQANRFDRVAFGERDLISSPAGITSSPLPLKSAVFFFFHFHLFNRFNNSEAKVFCLYTSKAFSCVNKRAVNKVKQGGVYCVSSKTGRRNDELLNWITENCIIVIGRRCAMFTQILIAGSDFTWLMFNEASGESQYGHVIKWLCVIYSGRTLCCCAFRSATRNRCATARPCGCRRSGAFAPIRQCCSSAAKTICASCTATRRTSRISRIAARSWGKPKHGPIRRVYLRSIREPLYLFDLKPLS